MLLWRDGGENKRRGDGSKQGKGGREGGIKIKRKEEGLEGEERSGGKGQRRKRKGKGMGRRKVIQLLGLT